MTLRLREGSESMKFNLKNRPKAANYYVPDVEKWFEGFEKQLRELDEMLTTQTVNDNIIQAWRNGRHVLI